mmetsp:Transcript_6148/g.13139  ORF Transcript_6148/g.13139 Transcript_6148/m.13139 type:complete len:92 (+) Transcript_6148:578-853(+)
MMTQADLQLSRMATESEKASWVELVLAFAMTTMAARTALWTATWMEMESAWVMSLVLRLQKAQLWVLELQLEADLRALIQSALTMPMPSGR